MKRALAFAAALTALTAASAYAVPQAPAPQRAVASTTATPAPAAQVETSKAAKPVLVAENRSEFGSQYQRY